jgi:hypothetical protein
LAGEDVAKKKRKKSSNQKRLAGEDVAKKVYTLNMSITYDTKKPGEFVEKGFQYGFPNVVLYVWTKKGKNGKV